MSSLRQTPLTCSGHTRPVVFLAFSEVNSDGIYFSISACKDGKPMLRQGDTGDWIGTFEGHKGLSGEWISIKMPLKLQLEQLIFRPRFGMHCQAKRNSPFNTSTSSRVLTLVMIVPPLPPQAMIRF